MSLSTESTVVISLKDFDLDFFDGGGPPQNSIDIGSYSFEVEGAYTSSIDESYYVVPLNDGKFDWALVRNSWDDNWRKYEWTSCARISGLKNPNAAAKAMVRALFESWRINMADEENKPYLEFYEQL
jgi:hypothetical protein